MNFKQRSDPGFCSAALHTEQRGLFLQSLKECPVSWQLVQVVGFFSYIFATVENFTFEINYDTVTVSTYQFHAILLP